MSYCDYWDTTSALNQRYHETEWGVPLHDDRRQFEHLMMEVLQCGLNWNMMMLKREIFRACFAGFDFDQVATFGESDIARILDTEGMIRAPRKIRAIINNARCFQAIRAEHGTFCNYIWGYAGGRTILYARHAQGWIPASNGLSARISQDLKAHGFQFLGPTTVYSHLQSCGIINDHSIDCPRYAQINATNPTVRKSRDAEVAVRCYAVQDR